MQASLSDSRAQSGWDWSPRGVGRGVLHFWEMVARTVQGCVEALAQRPLLAFSLWALWLSFLYFMLGSWSYVKAVDAGDQNLPIKILAASEWLHGGLGNWFTWGGCGGDRAMSLYGLELQHVLFMVLPGWLGYGLLMFLQRFIAGYFFFKLAREQLRAAAVAALLGGAAYALYYQLGIHEEWDGFSVFDGLGQPGIPFLLWALGRLHQSRRWTLPRAALLGIGLGLTSYYFQAIFYPFLAVFWFSLVRPTVDRRMLLIGFVFVMGWFAAIFPNLFANLDYAGLSHRQGFLVATNSPFVKYVEDVRTWPAVILRGNWVYLATAAIGLVLGWFRDRRLLWCLALTFAIFGFMREYPLFCEYFSNHFKILASFHTHRFMFLVPFLTAAAMVLGLESIPTDWKIHVPRSGWRISVVAVIATLPLFYLIWRSADINQRRLQRIVMGDNYACFYQQPDVQRIARKLPELPPFRVACVVDMWRPGNKGEWFEAGYSWAYGLESADGYFAAYSLRYKQFWSEVVGPLLTKDKNRYHQLEDWGNQTYLWIPTSGVIDEPFRKYYDLDLLSLANVRYVISPLPLRDPDLLLLDSDVRAEAIKNSDLKNSKRAFAAIRGEFVGKPLWIYENRRMLPRYQLRTQAIVCDSAADTLRTLAQMDVRDLATSAVLTRGDFPADLALDEHGGEAGNLQATKVNSDELNFGVAAPSGSILCVANNFSPYWHATLDGAQVEIFPVDHAFQGVYVPAGEHRVILKYEPPVNYPAVAKRIWSGKR